MTRKPLVLRLFGICERHNRQHAADPALWARGVQPRLVPGEGVPAWRITQSGVQVEAFNALNHFNPSNPSSAHLQLHDRGSNQREFRRDGRHAGAGPPRDPVGAIQILTQTVTGDTSKGQVIDSAKVRDLPLLGRNPCGQVIRPCTSSL